MPRAWTHCLEVLPWILVIGSLGAMLSPQRGWFVMELKRVVGILRLQSLEDVERLLNSLLWCDRIYRDALRKIWDEVVRL